MHLWLTRAGTALAVFMLPTFALLEGPRAQTDTSGTDIAGECLEELRAFNRQLVDNGYGVVGPRGYGIRSGRGLTGRFAAPRGQMGALINAAHVFALSGMEKRCEMVLEGARQIYKNQLQEGEIPRGTAFQEWRRKWLQAAIPATEWQGDLQIERVIQADVRNLRDEDLGDVDDVIVGSEGQIQYVLVGRGGFLGLGETLVPLPWQYVRITPRPYADTLVIPVSEEAFERAPALQREALDREALLSETMQKRLEQYWSSHIK